MRETCARYGVRMTGTSDAPVLDVRADDLSGAATRALIAAHHADMRATSPIESCHVLDVDALREPGVRFWSAWSDDRLAGIGALKDLGDGSGEIKSMRVDDAFRGTGVGRAVLTRILDDARERGMTRLWLETGSQASFAPARGLYASAGFELCEPFGDYRPDRHSVFMTMAL